MNTIKLEKQLKEAQEELATLKKVNASADEIEFVENEIKELEEKLKKAQTSKEEKKSDSKKTVEEKPTKRRGRKKVQKTVEEKPAKRRGRKKTEKSNLKKIVSESRSQRGVYEKKDKEIKLDTKNKNLPSELKNKKSKGLSVVYNGKTYYDSDPEFCNILIKQLEDRRNKRKASKPKRVSISSKVGDDIASSVVTAIKGAYKDKKEDILENKTTANKFLKTISRIEFAAQKFISEMKSILEDNFKQKDFDKEFKEVEEVIKKIKDTIKKNFE
jgi:hypothetical protein